MRQAMFYRTDGPKIVCELCPKGCVIGEGRTGFCRARKHLGGRLYSMNYAACSSYALDPIEKKPLYHFFPGSYIFSIGTWGCNFACSFCQNWQIAQSDPDTVELAPEKAVVLALDQGQKSIGIAYTYSEPGVWYEYISDTAELAQQKGLKNVMVTNGFINPGPLAGLLPLVDAFNIDVKAFNSKFYRELCQGELADVKRTVEIAAGRHVEITTLIIPGLNDSRKEITELARWLGGINRNIPLHFSRYFPNYKMSYPATPVSTLRMAYEAAREHLNYVYLGNVGGDGGNTRCPECAATVIDRMRRSSYLVEGNKCPKCGYGIYITGEVRF